MEATLRRGQGNEECLWSRHSYESYTGHWGIGIHEQCLQSIFGLHDGWGRFHQNLNWKRSCQCHFARWSSYVQVNKSYSKNDTFGILESLPWRYSYLII